MFRQRLGVDEAEVKYIGDSHIINQIERGFSMYFTGLKSNYVLDIPWIRLAILLHMHSLVYTIF